ncbi:MAG: nucleotidyl transferase AbiEii/AbiGii toxin family protein [Steroidobacteraceae bacterium]
MAALIPQLQILPANQRRLWSRLGETPPDFVLYGGTALALRLGHRSSIDFDFFARRAFQPIELVREIPYLTNQTIVQEGQSTLSCEVETGVGAVKISFFGGLSIGQIEPPALVTTNQIAVASLKDLFGMKCATVPQRNESKDYLDIHALMQQGGITLSEGMACAAAMYGRQYNPALTLQALSYFDDLHEALPQAVRAALLAAVKNVSLAHLPAATALQRIGDGVERSRA